MSATSVKFFHSGMPGAPTLNGVAGALIGVLDAALVNGWGLKTLDSLVVADGIATATISTGHSFVADSVALIAGVTGTTALNGEKRVLSVSTTQFTFDATGIADETATGTITAKVAPLGWSKAFSGTNKAAYKPTDVAATGCYLRVDDTGTVDARVVGYESMTDVDTGTGPFPTAAMRSGGSYWHKANSTTPSTARDWWLIGDERFFYLAVRFTTSTAHNLLQAAFGDLVPFSNTDAYHCILLGRATAAPSAFTSSDQDSWGSHVPGTPNASANTAVARSYTGAGTSKWLSRLSMWAHGNTASGSSQGAGAVAAPYPNGPDASLLLMPVHAFEDLGFRGMFPGLYHTPQNLPNAPLGETGAVIAGMGLAAGQKRMLFLVGYGSSAPTTNVTSGAAFIDHIGPWR